METVKDFFSILSAILLFGCPFIFIAGLIITLANKDKSKLGLKLLIGAVVGFIIGFGICLNNFNSSGMH